MVGDGEEVHRGGLPEKLDPGMLNDPRQEDLFDGRAGLVLVMKDARQGMGSLRRQVPFLIVARRAVEIDSDLIDQNFFNQSRALSAQQPGSFRGALARTGLEKVLLSSGCSARVMRVTSTPFFAAAQAAAQPASPLPITRMSVFMLELDMIRLNPRFNESAIQSKSRFNFQTQVGCSG